MKKIGLFVLLCGTVAFAPPALAVSDAEFEALKAQLSMMAKKIESIESEQSKIKTENTQLKAENAALKQGNETLVQKVSAVETKALQIETKAAQIETKAQQLAAITPAAGEETPKRELKPGEFMIPGTDTSLKFGGYIKADAIYDFNVSRTGNGEDFSLFAAIPLEGTAEERKGGNARLHARQTRLNLTSLTPTPYGDLKMFFEGDFYESQGNQNTTNADGFGLRHAYGELGPILMGQTWSNFMDMDAYPETLDYVGPTGITLLRQGQIRYTYKPEGSQNSFSIAAENPQTDFLSSPANPGADTSISQFPDITANAKFAGNMGEISVKGVVRDMGAYNSGLNNSNQETGYAVGVSGKVKVLEKDDIRFQVAYGDGIGRYMYDVAASTLGGGFRAAGDDFETAEAWGGYVAYRHIWNDLLRSNFSVGTTQITESPSFLSQATTNESIYSGEANLIWAVTPKFDLGGGYIYGYRETESGANGELHRAQVSGTFKF